MGTTKNDQRGALPLAAVSVTANANIALAKYWGKAVDAKPDVTGAFGSNVPAVPSLSVTLEGLRTTTSITPDPSLRADTFQFGHRSASPDELRRVSTLLDAVRLRASHHVFARVESDNHFPTRSGLASSASGFAALTVGALAAYGLGEDLALAAELARQASASSARSLFSGFAELKVEAGVVICQQVAPPDALPLTVLVCVVTEGEKPIGSREAMAITRAKSGLYGAWRTFGEENFFEQRRALLEGDFAKLGELAEASALTMHATAIAAGIMYFDATTLALYAAVRALRAQGTPVFATMDAGPHVKVLVSNTDVASVRDALAAVPGVVRILTATPGQGARVTSREGLPA